VFLTRSRAIRDQGPDPYEESPEAEAWIELVFDAAVQALADLDREGTFGPELDRAQLVLSIWGDQPTEERLEYAYALNPASVATRFARELEDGNRAFEKVFPRPGGAG
jgi:Domain of unknown function (DUF4303)